MTKKTMFRAKRAPTKGRPKKPRQLPPGSDVRMPGASPEEIEKAGGGPLDPDSYPRGTKPPPSEPLHPTIEDLYPHLEETKWPTGPGKIGSPPARHMPPITKWP